MPFDINQFLGEISRGGVTKTNLYDIIVTRTAKPDVQVERQISMRAENFNLPSRSSNVVEIPYVGPTLKIGTDAHYENITMTIILSEDQGEREYFEEWLDLIAGKMRTDGESSKSSYGIGYYNEYVGTIKAIVFNEVEDQTYAYDFINAFPVSVEAIEMNYNDVQVAKLSVTFAFHYYKTEKL